MSEVFVSYKRENLAAVGRLVEALRAEGIGVWWDQDIPPNAAWEATIEKALAAAKLVIVAWSPAAVASENVKAEARGARAQGRLLQVFVEACEPPLFFGERQGVDLKNWSGGAGDPAFRALFEAVRKGLATAAIAPPAPQVVAAPPPPLPSKPSIAVLPFTNITGGKDEDYFSDGMVEEIVTALSRFPALFVIASASSLTYRGDSRGQGKIATELGVRYLLDGSVRRSGARVRIAVKLADALAGEQIWAERFDGDLDDVFALQDDVARAVAGQIAPTIEAADTRRAHARPTSDLTAYEFYLRALHRERDFDQQALQDTVVLLDQALALDPKFARALALQSMMHSIPDLLGRPELLGQDQDSAASRQLALDLARRAMSEGSDDPEVLGVVSNTFLWAGEDVAVADALAERALALNPGASFVWFPSAWVKLFGGRPALAIEHFETHLRLDPKSPNRAFVNGGMGLAQLLLGHFDAAIPLLKEAIQQVPEHPFYRAGLAAACGHLGRPAEAAPHLRALNPNQIRSVLDLCRRPEDREIVRSGLALAGADV